MRQKSPILVLIGVWLAFVLLFLVPAIAAGMLQLWQILGIFTILATLAVITYRRDIIARRQFESNSDA